MYVKRKQYVVISNFLFIYFASQKQCIADYSN